MKLVITSTFYLAFLLLGTAPAFAAGEGAQTFTLDGRLYADAAATTALTDPDVNITLQVLNPTQNCILYEETQSHFNAAIGNGYFTLQVGSALGAGKRSALDSAHAMSLVYSNNAGSISGRTLGGGACSYSPAAGDVRAVRMLVIPSSDGVTRVLSPNMVMDAVPMAVVAERAENVQGLGAANILQVNTSGPEALSQTNLENIFSSSNYTALTSLLAGSSGLYSKPAANGTTPLANVTSPASPSAGQMWYDSGAIKFYDGSSTQTLGVSGAGISSVVAGTGLNVGAGPGGTITSTGTLNVDTGTTTGKIVQVAASNKLPVIDGSNLTNLAGSAISGTIGGATVVNTSGALTTSGNITGATVTGTSVVGTTGSFGSTSTGQLSLYDNAVTGTNYVTLKTPNTATLTADYTLTLPSALPGSSGQVLTSDTSGNLTWSSPSSGSVVSVGGTAPVSVTGTASAPVVNVSAATTSVSGVVTLAANGGTTASTVVQATDSRLTDSRAPNGLATGDLSGSYPNPTVVKLNGVALLISSLTSGDHLKYNGTNWVNAALSSADLSNDSNLLKASNMPANCASGSSLTFSSPTGTWVCTTIPDATASSKGIMQVGTGLAVSSGTVSLTSGVVTAGTYSKVTVDTYGRVTTGASIGSSDVTTALGFTPVNKAGDVMTGAFGLSSYTSAAETTLTASYGTSDKGKMWFNSDLKKIHMWDGSAVESIASPPTPTVAQDGQSLKWNNTTKAWDYFTAGAAGAGIGTFNTLTANTQTLATGTGGTAPNWSSVTSTHTLNIPLASTASVTAGLISKTDYDNFNTKVGTSYSLAGDVTGTPATTSVDKIKGKAVTTPTVSGQMLVYDGTGITPVVMSSDATMLATGALTLKNTGTAGTYPKVTTDAQGRVISGTTLSASDIPSLDWTKITTGTPTTLAGYGITDAVGNLGGTPGIKTGLDASKPASPAAGTIYFATDTNKIWQYNSGAWSVIASAVATSYSGVLPIANGGTNSSTALTNNKIMVSSGGSIVEAGAMTNGQVFIGSTGAAPVAAAITQGSGISVTNGAGSITIATTGLGSTSLADGKIWVGQTTTPTAVTPAGDVTMTNAGSFSVTKAQGTAISATAPTITGQTLRYNTGTSSWEPKFISMADLRSTITGSSALTSCTSGQTLTWSAATDNLACSNITVSASNFGSQTANTVLAAPNGTAGTPTFRALASTDLPSGVVTTGTYKSVTVDTYGRVTAGTNPTTAAGYGITDAFINGGNSFGGAATLGTNDNNTLGFKTNGTVNMTMLANGNVGIGTTAPALPLHISATGNTGINTGSIFKIQAAATNWGSINFTDNSSTNAYIGYQTGSTAPNKLLGFAVDSGTPQMVLNSAGNVGIGTTTPNTKLDVNGGTALRGLTQITDGYGVSGAGLAIGGGGSSPNAGSVAWGDGSGWKLNFGTTISSTFTPRVTMMDSGNVGIGTTAPGSPLDVRAASDASLAAQIGGSSTPRIQFYGDSGAGTGAQINFNTGNGGSLTTANGSGANIYVKPGNGGPSVGTTFLYNGNVGVGTTSPAAKLDVRGVFNADYQAVTHTPNGDFETGTLSGFTGFTTINSTDSVNGKYSAEADGNTAIYGSELIPISPQVPLYLEAWVKSIGVGNSLIYIGTVAYDANKNFITGNGGTYGYCAASAVSTPNSWTKYNCLLQGSGSGNNQFPVGTKFVTPLMLLNYGQGATYKVLVDGIRYTTGNPIQYDSNGNVGIGTSSPNTKLHIEDMGNSTWTTRVRGGTYGLSGQAAASGGIGVQGYNEGTGSYSYLGYSTYGIYCGAGTCGGASAWTNVSDRRLKENITPLDGSLEKVLSLKGVSYDWIDPKQRGIQGHQLGLIAQDVEKVFPEAVHTDHSPASTFKDGTKMLQYTALLSPIIESIKEFYAKWFADSQDLHSQLQNQEKRIQQLEFQNEILMKRLEKVEQTRAPSSVLSR